MNFWSRILEWGKRLQLVGIAKLVRAARKAERRACRNGERYDRRAAADRLCLKAFLAQPPLVSGAVNCPSGACAAAGPSAPCAAGPAADARAADLASGAPSRAESSAQRAARNARKAVRKAAKRAQGFCSKIIGRGRRLRVRLSALGARLAREAEQRRYRARQARNGRRAWGIESLEPRLALTTFVLDPGIANPSIDGAVFLNPSGSGADVAYVNSPTNNIVIQQTSSTPETVSIPADLVDLVVGSMTFQQTTATPMKIDVSANVTASSISFDANGPYTLSFPTAGSNKISGGTISVQSTLKVDAAIAVTAEVDSAITGPGGIETTDDGTVVLGSPANSYSGGTDIDTGELQMKKGSGAVLGSGPVGVGNYATLDLEGCSQTFSSLTGSGIVTDQSTASPFSTIGTTVLTIDYTNTSTSDLYSGEISDFNAGPADASIRLVKIGAGSLVLGGTVNISGGTELDDGGIVLDNRAVFDSATETDALVINGGTLDLNGNNLSVYSLSGAGGVITDTSAGPNISTIAVSGGYLSGAPPEVFAGSIDDGSPNDGNPGVVLSLVVDGGSLLTLTGANAYTGGTYIGFGWLQVGDGTSLVASIEGPVYDNTQNGLTFDVANGDSETFNGGIFNQSDTADPGSVLKTGGGTLTLTGNRTYGPSTYGGAMTVYAGTLILGDDDALAAGSPLIVDGGATVDLDGNSTATLSSVTLNNGSIVSSAGGATLNASDSFNLANGSIGSTGAGWGTVTLGGAASLNKRTAGTVDIYGTSSNLAYLANGGGTFDDQGSLVYVASDGDLTTVSPSGVTLLYWNPPADASSPAWDGTSAYWFNGTTDIAWPTNDTTTAGNDVTNNYIAVFDTAYANGFTSINVSTTVDPSGIQFDESGFTISDDGNAGSEILIPDGVYQPGASHQSLLVTFASAGLSDALSCAITDDVTSTLQTAGTYMAGGGGSVTIEGGGTLTYGGADGNSYTSGTYIDAGTVTLALGSVDAFGALLTYGASQELPDSADLIVDGSSTVVNLNQQNTTISSLNSSYSTSDTGATITDKSSGSSTTTLTVEVSGTPGFFAGQIMDGPAGSPLLALLIPSGSGLSLTLTGSNQYTGGTTIVAGLQIGDGFVDGNASIEGVVNGTGEGDLIFDVGTGTEVFNGEITSPFGFLSLLKTGGGLLELAGDTDWGSSSGNDYDGLTYVEGGTLQLGDDTAIPANSSVVVDAGATLNLYGNSLPLARVTLNGGAVDGSATITVAQLIDVRYGTISASLAGTATLLKSLGAATDTVVLSGENNFSGATLVAEGTLEDGGSAGLSDSSSLTVSQGTLDLGGNAVTTDLLVNVIGGEITDGTLNLADNAVLVSAPGSTIACDVVYDSSTTTSIAQGAINGSGNTLTVSAGTLTLAPSGTNGYGATVVTGGTLIVATAGGLPDGGDLTIGDASAFSGGIPGDDFARGGSYGDSDTSDTGSDDTGSSDAGSSPGVGLSANSPLGQIEAAGTDMLNVIADTFDATHAQSASDMLNALTTDFNVIVASMALNNGARTNSADIIASAVTEVLETAGMSVTAASGTPNYVQAEAAGDIANIATFTTQTPAIEFDVYVLYVFANYTIEPGD